MVYLRNLRSIRKQHKLSREKLAELADCDIMTIRRAEVGHIGAKHTGIQLHSAVAIADALGVGMDDLLGRSVPRGTAAIAEVKQLLTTYQP